MTASVVAQYLGVATPFGAVGGGGTGRHSPVARSSCLPGTQNGEHPLVTPVSPGAHAELGAGVTIVATAIDPADRTAADATMNTPRHTALVIGCLLMSGTCCRRMGAV